MLEEEEEEEEEGEGEEEEEEEEEEEGGEGDRTWSGRRRRLGRPPRALLEASALRA